MHGTLKTGQRVEPSHMDHTAAGDVQGPSTPAPLVRSLIPVLMDVQTLDYDMPKSNVRSRRSEIFLTVGFHRPVRSEKKQPFIQFS